MKRLSLIFVLLICTLVAFAIPAANVTITHTQKDGTVLTLRLVGDEHMHYYKNVATGQAMYQDADGDFKAISAYELSAQAEQAAVRRSEINRQRVARLPLMQQRAREGMHKIGTIDKNLSGNKSVLVLLVAFSDKAFSGTQSDFVNQFNQQNYSANSHIGSVHDYFYDQSYGALNLSFDVYGPVTLSNNMAYYGANDANGNDVRPQQMVKDALTKVNQSTDIDYTKYDWDNDGEVDQVVVIYAGYAEAQGASENTIWPHQWAIGRSASYRFDGKYVNSYACLSELLGNTGSTRDGIGTFCHEFSHCLGLPDFYDTNYEDDGSANDMSYFDLMAAGSYNGTNNAVPCGYTAYERWQFGWVTPTELSEPATITGMKPLNDADADTYVIYNKSNSNEYFLLENRQSNRWFQYISTYPAGHGLFITHCNYVSSYWTNNTINATAGDEHFVYVPATQSYELLLTNLQKAFFPAGATSFTDDSHASYGGALWTNNSDGTKKLGVPITDITESNGLISFDVLGGLHDDGSRYTITLNACGGTVAQTAWTQTSYKQTWSLPEPTTTVVGWEGAGWSLTEVKDNTPLDDVDLIDYNKPYTPESNVTLYAVYMNDDFICNSYPPIPLPFGTYYSSHSSSLDGKNGQALELALTSIIYTHTKRSYDHHWTDFKTTDVVPNTTDQVYDMYSSNVYHYSTASHSTDFNREHSVPNSWWGGESGNSTAYTDLHHLVPSDVKANSLKSNYPLGCGHGLVNAQSSHTDNSAALLWSFASTGADSYGGGSGHVWEPEDQYKGDFARMYLYIVCAYEGNITWQTEYMFTSDGSKHTTIKPWAKELLLKWHRQDPVSQKERLRNNAVYGIQGNRNPFIDYPEFVEYIWGDKSSQTFSLSSAQSAYSAEYIAANTELTGTGNGTVCNDDENDDDDDPVVPTEPGTTALYFPHIAKVGQPFIEPAFSTDSDGAQTWTSSNTAVATVDSKGKVTIKAVGTTIITVTQAETSQYKQGTASYMIKVIE